MTPSPSPSLSALVLLLAALAACSTTSASFVESQPGFAVIKGRVQRVDDLDSADFRRLADGVAVVVQEPGCSITMQFADGATRTIQLKGGAMVLWGRDADFVLRPEPN